MATVETLLKNSCKGLGEGPHWDDRTGQLLFVDILDHSVHRWTAATGVIEKHTFDGACSLVVPRQKGDYMVSVDKSICQFDWDTKQTKVVATVDEDKPTQINDGKCDALGRLWFGTVGKMKTSTTIEKEQSSLFSLDLDGTVKKHKSGVSISNGLAWTEDNRTMFYIDSIPGMIWAYDFDLASGEISNERTVVSFAGEETMSSYGSPDGMTIDNEGKLWVACMNGGRIVRFDPETGKEMDAINVPTQRPTSCCFGGKHFDELFITSCRFGLEEEALAGSVFRATGHGVHGKAAYIYQG